MPVPSRLSRTTAAPKAKISTTGMTTTVWARNDSPDSHSSMLSHQFRKPSTTPDYAADPRANRRVFR